MKQLGFNYGAGAFTGDYYMVSASRRWWDRLTPATQSALQTLIAETIQVQKAASGAGVRYSAAVEPEAVELCPHRRLRRMPRITITISTANSAASSAIECAWSAV